MTSTPSSVAPAEQCRHWALFADWCTATRHCPLPASPATMAAFLAEMPAGSATVARRVRAIDTAHRAAGLPAPGASPELDALLGRHPPPPRFHPDLVARALQAIPVGGWPVGIVGRRDAAIVALICSAGLTRAQVQALRVDGDPAFPLGSPTASPRQPIAARGQRAGEGCSPRAPLEAMPRADGPGACPACALSRWLRVAHQLERAGWRTVRVELADYGEVPAAAEAAHDCAQPLAWPVAAGEGASPLFCAVDRHGVPQTGWALSARSITAIVAERLAFAEGTDPEAAVPGPDRRAGAREGVSGRDWGIAQRRAAEERFAQMEATLAEAEEQAEALLARVDAAMGEEVSSPRRGGEDGTPRPARHDPRRAGLA